LAKEINTSELGLISITGARQPQALCRTQFTLLDLNVQLDLFLGPTLSKPDFTQISNPKDCRKQFFGHGS
jgi:hypothetical protein